MVASGVHPNPRVVVKLLREHANRRTSWPKGLECSWVLGFRVLGFRVWNPIEFHGSGFQELGFRVSGLRVNALDHIPQVWGL